MALVVQVIISQVVRFAIILISIFNDLLLVFYEKWYGCQLGANQPTLVYFLFINNVHLCSFVLRIIEIISQQKGYECEMFRLLEKFLDGK